MPASEAKLIITLVMAMCLMTVILSLGVVFDALGTWPVITALMLLVVLQAVFLGVFSMKAKAQHNKVDTGLDD